MLEQLQNENDDVFPHAWKGGIGCFTLGLVIMILTVLLALLTPCCRYCMCCSVFMVSSIASIYSVLSKLDGVLIRFL